MGSITLKQAAEWCGGRVAARFADVTFDGANFDTRRLRAGELFVALHGARDGHDFIEQAMQNGAAAVLASKPQAESIPAVYVNDPHRALQDIAAAYRARLACRVVGITGSVGKTTTKEMVAAVLGKRYRTFKTDGNFNNDIGVPIMLLRIPPDCEAAVIEMGMNHFGELSVLTRLARPDIALITEVGTMHIENLGSREGILRAKLEILEGLRPNGRAVFNGDNDLLAREREKYGALTFGLSGKCDVRGLDLHTVGETTAFTAETAEGDFNVTLPLVGTHNVIDALAAVAIGRLFAVPNEEIAAALAEFANTGHRQRAFDCGGVHIIDDCYNAGPESMRAALDVLAQRDGRRIAVLGGMLELGDFAPTAHREVGAYAAERVDALLAYGACGEEYVRGARENGLSDATCYETHEALYAALENRLRVGDSVLIKGSRGMHMEKIVNHFTENYSGGK